MAGASERSTESVGRDGKVAVKTLRQGISKAQAEKEREMDGAIATWENAALPDPLFH